VFERFYFFSFYDLKGTPDLVLYASNKIGTIRYTDWIILQEK
jgi:hypothetical protein